MLDLFPHSGSQNMFYSLLQSVTNRFRPHPQLVKHIQRRTTQLDVSTDV